MRISVSFIIILAALGLAACSGSSVVKPAVTSDSAIGRWQVVTTEEASHDGLCYAVSAPVRSEGMSTGKRGAPYLMATRRASGKIEVSTFSGYPYKPESLVELATAKTTFELDFKDSVAWAQDDKQDKTILKSLRKAGEVEVRGVTTHDTTTVDVYSTAGFAEALARVKELCP